MSIRSEDPDQPPLEERPFRPEILIAESEPARLALVARIVEGLGCVARPWAGGLPRVPRDACMALVSLDCGGRGIAAEPASAGRAQPLRYLVYAAGAGAWPVGRRCEYLLGGAIAVLDSGDEGFAAELAGHVGRVVKQERERSAAESRAKASMEALGVAGESQAMVEIFQFVLRASQLSELPVLLSGETGTGKEVIAAAIHRLDPRRSSGPLIAVNCGAIPATLAESELFGHRKGAFTGAEQARKGLLRAADRGTLFLDEVSELDAAMQTKLLRVLQDSRVTALGEEESLAVDFRLIAASNRDLPELVRGGAFRADLYHRLNVLAIRIPPLRERREDIPPLIEHFLRKHANVSGGRARGASPEYIEALARHELPGNVRQLENLVRWSLANKEEAGPLRLPDLPREVWAGLARAPAASETAAAPERRFFEELLTQFDGSLSRSLGFCERQLLEAALLRSGGNQTKAARLVGLTPRSIYNKIRKHRLAS
jgi:two-component system response regulator PilR (NtrC family)